MGSFIDDDTGYRESQLRTHKLSSNSSGQPARRGQYSLTNSLPRACCKLVLLWYARGGVGLANLVFLTVDMVMVNVKQNHSIKK
jgi:hypothetical protein